MQKGVGHQPAPRITFDPNDPDDMAFLADDELGDAPADPGTYEAGFGKPQAPDQRLNKWCVRECERSEITPRDSRNRDQLVELWDFSKRQYNQPWKHQAAEGV